MSHYPLISIITPSYNQGKFIERTIKSVLNQNYPNLEYIVMDGGSTDGTLDVLKKYENKITWVSEPDNGQTHAINKGFKIAKGDILAYLNSDDTYEVGTLKKIANYFKKHPRVAFLYGKGRIIDENDKELGFYQSKTTDHNSLAEHCPISQPTTFWRRKVYEEIGEFNEEYQFTMDYEYWIRVSKKFKLHYLKNTTLANARVHQDAKTSSFYTKLHLDAIKVVKAHYGKVHFEWITNYINSFSFLKKGSFTYYLSLIIGSFILNLIWNKDLPTRNIMRKYFGWVKEYYNKLLS